MDLIYTNANFEDVGVFHDYSFDLAFGTDENDFELKVDSKNHCFCAKCLVYIEGTEYGGIIDGIAVDTSDDKLTYNGRTWHGILETRVIEPNENEPYYIVSGEANAVIGTLIEKLGLSDLFEASTKNSGLVIKEYQFARYVDAYKGITNMLESVSGKMQLIFKNGKVVISALPVVDYSEDEQFDNDQIELRVEKAYSTVNHLICLGKGELTERLVVHLYSDADGNISEKQTFYGIDEVVKTYELNTADTTEKLIEDGTKKLKEYNSGNKVEMDFEAELTVYDVGDIVGAKEITTGVFVKEKITKKIVTIEKGVTNIEYKVGE